jgi:outer membrane receptor protein involved in Fe transport
VYPSAGQSLRLSAGSAFRNPTLTENHLFTMIESPNPGTQLPNPPYTTFDVTVRGNPALGPERVRLVEIAHSAMFPRVRTTVTAFRYRLRDIITTNTTSAGGAPPTWSVEQSFANRGSVTNTGGEAALEVFVLPELNAYANWSHQRLESTVEVPGLAAQSPSDKWNAGVRWRSGGFTGNLLVHHVGRTRWPRTPYAPYPSGFGTVRAYTLVDAGTGHAFDGRFRGLELRLSAFNLLNNRHCEILPATGPTEPGEGGEVIGRRIVASVSCSF